MEFVLLAEEQYFSGAADGHFFNERDLEKIRRLVERLEQAKRAEGGRGPPGRADSTEA